MFCVLDKHTCLVQSVDYSGCRLWSFHFRVFLRDHFCELGGTAPSHGQSVSLFVTNLSGRPALTFCPHLGPPVRDKKLGKVFFSAPRSRPCRVATRTGGHEVISFLQKTVLAQRVGPWRAAVQEDKIMMLRVARALAPCCRVLARQAPGRWGSTRRISASAGWFGVW